MFRKLFRFLRFSMLMAGFIFLLLPFMFFSVLNKGVKKAKNLLGFKKSADDQSFFDDIDNQAWADVPVPVPGPGCNIHFSYEDKEGAKKWFNHISPRTHKALNLISLPKEAVLPNGDLNLYLNWTKRHHMISLGIIEYNHEIAQVPEMEEITLAEARRRNEAKNYAPILTNRNRDYAHTIQGDEINLVFKEKSGKEIKMQIQEMDPEESFIDQIKLFKIKHKNNEEVVTSANSQGVYVVPKDQINGAALPNQVFIKGREENISEVIGSSFLNFGKGIYLEKGEDADISFSGLKKDKSYSLVIITKDRGFSPSAKTVLSIVPALARGMALAGAALVLSRFFNKISLIFPFFALYNGSTPYLRVWDGEKYVLENDIMHSSFGYNPDFKIAKNNYESGKVKPDVYCVKNLKNELPDDYIETYLFSASGFYTDLRLQNHRTLKNLRWLFNK